MASGLESHVHLEKNRYTVRGTTRKLCNLAAVYFLCWRWCVHQSLQRFVHEPPKGLHTFIQAGQLDQVPPLLHPPLPVLDLGFNLPRRPFSKPLLLSILLHCSVCPVLWHDPYTEDPAVSPAPNIWSSQHFRILSVSCSAWYPGVFWSLSFWDPVMANFMSQN